MIRIVQPNVKKSCLSNRNRLTAAAELRGLVMPISGFVHVRKSEIQGLFKDFQGHVSDIIRHSSMLLWLKFYGVISPPKFKISFRHSNLQFNIVVHNCNIRVSSFNNQLIVVMFTMNIRVALFNIVVHNATFKFHYSTLFFQ